jgi:ribonuclease M5
MKLKMNALIVVEGVKDVQKLTPLIDADFLTTNGSALSVEVIEFIRQAKTKGREVIVFTDPDFPGEKIRQTLEQAIPGLTHAFVEKKFAISHGKVGVAEATEVAILKALSEKLTPHPDIRGTLTMQDLAKLGFIGDEHAAMLREKTNQYFHLGPCNVKTMLKRLNVLGIGYDELKAIL